MKAPDTPEDFTLHFEKGLPVKLEYTEKGAKKTVTEAVELFLTANAIARRNGVGRIDIVENRFIGLKSRGKISCSQRGECCKLTHIQQAVTR